MILIKNNKNNKNSKNNLTIVLTYFIFITMLTINVYFPIKLNKL
jgi:hypothetical protein